MKSETIYLRITPELKEELRKLAEADGRSLSGYLLYILQMHVDELQKSKG